MEQFIGCDAGEVLRVAHDRQLYQEFLARLPPLNDRGGSERQLAGTHVVRLYQRIKRSKNHQKAVVAVARHLAEAAWWVLAKQKVYREPHGPRQQALSSTHG